MQKCAHPLPKQTVVKNLLLRNTWHGKESRNLCSFLVQCHLPRRTGDAVYFLKNLAHPHTSLVQGQCLSQVVTQVGLLRERGLFPSFYKVPRELYALGSARCIQSGQEDRWPLPVEFIGKETKAPGGEIRSPRSAQQVAEACLRAGPLHCLSGKGEESCVLPRWRGLTYAFLFLSGKTEKHSARGGAPRAGELPPETEGRSEEKQG